MIKIQKYCFFCLLLWLVTKINYLILFIFVIMKKLLFTLSFLIQFKLCAAQELTLPPLFDSHKPVHLFFAADMMPLIRDVGNDPGYHPATITYFDNDSIPVSIPLKARTRGNFRSDRQNCNFPPLKLNFNSSADNTLFGGQDKIKIVTHCQNRRNRYEQYLVQEYLAYRIYNILTDYSFQVRLANVKYIDTGGNKKTIEKRCFFIENKKEMAKRCGGKILKKKKIHQEWCDKRYITLFCVYQYLIGNTDWSVPALHNVILIKLPFQKEPIPVPYDLDWAGIVGSSYAKPSPNLPISSVSERLFRGYMRKAKEYEWIIKLFNEKKEEIYNLYKKCPHLSKRSKRLTLKYIDEFYQVINNPKYLENEFIRGARQD